MKKLLSSLVLVAAAGSQLGSTDCGQVIRDPGFDLWCGDSLCAWKTERGAIQKVPTWNRGDWGVEFDGSDVAIEQLSPAIETCIEFDLIANVEPTADVELHIDLDGDGSVEHSERIPTSSWKPLKYLLAFQGAYSGIRFEIAKTGSGKAVIAQVEAQVADDSQCNGFTRIIAAPAPDGAACGDNSGCRSGLCIGNGFGGQCAACDPMTATCGTGQVCGLGAPTSPIFNVPVECVPAGSHQLGEECIADTECATGICQGFFCSTCRANNTGCATGEQCGPAWPKDPLLNPNGLGPLVCQPNLQVRKSGEPCASDDDCASGTCDGTARTQCTDGRECASAANCPFGGAETANGLQNGPCNAVGVQGGSCR